MSDEIVVTPEMLKAAHGIFDDFASIRRSGLGWHGDDSPGWDRRGRDEALTAIYRAMRTLEPERVE